ncbi:PAS domain-containing protein [Steroidobacter sp. S1-65]|uniref:PAS domain-containing protein n=1 Tax=Steroidobacter gossypii TaxID=2805490 RepID=A0ABS1WQ80_9GAMM|nr:PAS domain-containing protein [Steroidobacter gossypii]MBM0103115.1 PAS domain-containing protein [Steroidobacter gossypii]
MKHEPATSSDEREWRVAIPSKSDRPTVADRRAEKVRSWRRRALLKRGARLHMAMVANAHSSSLASMAMLDEAGTVVSWYGSPDGRDYASEEVVDRHLSLFYSSEEVSRRQPDRDLRAAVIEGRITRQAWRRRRDGTAFWGTIDIEPVVLRDGRVQGFSYVASAPDQFEHSLR